VDTLILIVAFWFILIGIYGAFVLPNGSKSFRQASSRTPATALFHDAFASSQRVEDRRPAPTPRPEQVQLERRRHDAAAVRDDRPTASGFSSEVDMLRAQVEELRSEIAALSSAPGGRPDRPRMRRHGIGVYTYLPRLLRRQVREIRSVRSMVTRG
jgi:hypothetical protein